MGTWNYGLLDNDTACDALGGLSVEVRGDITRFGEDPNATDQLCAAVGVLLQLSAYDFDETEGGPQIAAAVTAHAAQIATRPAAVRSVMEAVARGEGQALAERRDPAHAAIAGVIKHGATQSRFGERHAALFATPAAAAYVQAIADRCVAAIEEEMKREDDWSDMCREMGSLGLVAVLLVIAPYEMTAGTVERWRENARTGISQLRERKDEELSFHEKYYASVDAAFALLLAR